MPTPTCHRTLGPSLAPPKYLIQRGAIDHESVAALLRDSDSMPIERSITMSLLPEPAHGRPCLGSQCALWNGVPGKNGYCADNPDRIRDDPAGDDGAKGKV